jgi:Protein of unknown function (DUF3574)
MLSRPSKTAARALPTVLPIVSCTTHTAPDRSTTMRYHPTFAALALALAAALPGAAAARPLDLTAVHCRGSADAEAFARTELFFGLSRQGGVISESEFKAFVDTQVTPRFPDGLTLLSGVGQFRDAGGTILVEGSKLLILLYPRRDRDADAKIEQIRREYRRAFQQQSVLRADDVSCVSF